MVSPRITSFKRIVPRGTSLAEVALLSTRTFPGTHLPLVLEPSLPDIDLADWAGANRSQLEDYLLVHGALLLRGFGIHSAEAFEHFCCAAVPELYDDYGDLPRESETEKIYGSTPYPATKTILFHNESSHTPLWPMKQFFFCSKAAEKGGETPLVDCRRVYDKLDPAIRIPLAEKGLLYVRHFTDGLDVKWQDFFHTSDRSEVESRCAAAGINCRWAGDHDLGIAQRAPAVARHPKTGAMVFFNQIQLHHSSCLDPEVRESLVALFDADQRPRDVYYGDGTPIEDSVVAEVTGLYWELAVAFPWQEGDVVMLDNMLVAHARNPFEGTRKILVAMGEMVDKSVL